MKKAEMISSEIEHVPVATIIILYNSLKSVRGACRSKKKEKKLHAK